MTKSDYQPFELGDWLVEPEFDRISRKGAHVPVQPKAMELLVYLARNRGHVVGAEDILDDLWGDVVVASGSVYVCINQLRDALGDDSQHPAYIETITKRGYLLIAPVRYMDAQDGDSDIPGLASGTAGGRRKKTLALALAGLIALVLLAVVYQFSGLTRAPTVPQASIAVLPFTDLSPEGNQEFLANGVAEELLNALARVPQLRVTGRRSSFTFSDASGDLRAIGETLGVAHILDGSVRRDGDRMRITAQLIDVDTGFHLWSATYDRELEDIFAVQDEISAAIVAALSDSLGIPLPSAPRVQRTANSAAYDEYLLGILETGRRSGASLNAAKQHLERALELDPDYAPAHARLAITLALLTEYNKRYKFKDVREAQAYHADRAMALAPDAPESLAAKGIKVLYNDGPRRKVRAIFERVAKLNPSNAEVLIWLALISADLGDYQARIDLFAQALGIDPLAPLTIANNADLLINAGRFDEAGILVDRLRTISPPLHWAVSANLETKQGLTAEAAIDHLEQLAVDPASVFGRNNLARMLTFGLGLADETSKLDHGHGGVMVLHGQIEEALVRGEDNIVARDWAPTPKGQVLLAAGRPGEAVGYLNQAWDMALAIASVDWFRMPAGLVGVGRARQMTGDQAGGEEALEATLAVIARRRAVGYSNADLDWSEGVARYFLGQQKAGLKLAARALDRGFVVYLMQPQYRPLTDDPAFAPILAAREALVAAERGKFLALVCNGGNPAPQVWTPKPETCESYMEG